MSRFLLACGGTGGHLAPGIALAETLRERGHASTLLISRKQVDARLGRKYGELEFVAMPGAGFSLWPAGLLRFVSSQAQAVFFAGSVMRRQRPDLVVGFGGFTTAAVALAARSAGVPVALHEANRVPGRAIRLAGGMARRVYLPPGVAAGGLRDSVVRHCGLPVRREMKRRPRAAACAALGLDPARRVVVVLGGSQGAQSLNAWARAAAAELAAANIQVICVTGPAEAGAAPAVENTGPDGSTVRAVFLPFSDDMATLLSAADLAITRAGAGTIAELVRMNLPAILVPYPHAADNHQVANARHFEQKGGGFVLEQDFLGDLTRETMRMLANDGLMRQLAHNLQSLDRDDAATFMADDLEKLLPGRERPAPVEAGNAS